MHVEIHDELVHLLFEKIKVFHDQVLIDNIQEMNLLLFEMHYVKRLNILPRKIFKYKKKREIDFKLNLKRKEKKTRCKHKELRFFFLQDFVS